MRDFAYDKVLRLFMSAGVNMVAYADGRVVVIIAGTRTELREKKRLRLRAM